MAKYLVLYKCPVSVLEEWMQKPEEERKEAEQQMQESWKAWMSEHAGAVKETCGAGATTRVTSAGSEKTKNDVMMYSMVEAESPEAAAGMFEGHPHLGITQASIEVMPTKEIS